MTLCPLKTANLSVIFKNKNELKTIQDFQTRGMFDTWECLLDLSRVNSIIEQALLGKTKKGNKPSDSTLKDYLRLVGRAIRVGREKELYEMDEDEQKSYSLPIYAMAREIEKRIQEGRNDVDPNVEALSKTWINDCEKIKANYEEVALEVYNCTVANSKQIFYLQECVIGILACLFYNVRLNLATLKNFKYPNINWAKDNILIYDDFDNCSILWNTRKVDRSAITKNTNASGSSDMDTIDSTASQADDDLRHPFLQHLATPPYEELKNTFLDPQYAGEVLTRFVKRFRAVKEYVFYDVNGKAYGEKDEKNAFDGYGGRVEASLKNVLKGDAKLYRPLNLRRTHATMIRKDRLSQNAIKFFSRNMHHDKKESGAYCKDS
ncbi:hypothetical protein DFS34DRAFT_593025 [Phlyctochytrium arcticum]|nr:hypothetical protein DFS34DRAFT_593025 [Phlyctochytrium arcticum]